MVTTDRGVDRTTAMLNVTRTGIDGCLTSFRSGINLGIFSQAAQRLVLAPFNATLLPCVGSVLSEGRRLGGFVTSCGRRGHNQIAVCTPANVVACLSGRMVSGVGSVNSVALSLGAYGLRHGTFCRNIRFPSSYSILVDCTPPGSRSLITDFVARCTMATCTDRHCLRGRPVDHPSRLRRRSYVLVSSVVVSSTGV